MSLSDPSLLARLRIGHGFDVHRFGEGDHLTSITTMKSIGYEHFNCARATHMLLICAHQ